VKTLNQVLQEVHDTTDFSMLENVDVNTRGLFENTPLHVVMSWGDVEAAELLVAAGADVNAQGEYGDTPLHRIIGNNNKKMVDLLLRSGANPRLKNKDGVDCYELAKKFGEESFFQKG
jgi:uncharacterized protein